MYNTLYLEFLANDAEHLSLLIVNQYIFLGKVFVAVVLGFN